MDSPEYHVPENRPTSLYKYLHSDRIDVLENLKVRFTQPAAFNDIFESYPGSNFKIDYDESRAVALRQFQLAIEAHPGWSMRERRRRFLQRMAHFEEWYKRESAESYHERMCREAQLQVSCVSCVFCVSGKWDNILMWSHYANEHRGFVIEFDGHHDFFTYGFDKVIYSDERPILGLGTTEENGRNDPAVFNTKSIDWAYEDEFRLTHFTGEEIKLPDGNRLVRFPDVTEVEPRNWPLHLRDVPPTAIRRVYFGHRTPPDVNARIRSALNAQSLLHVAMAQVRPHRQFFRMVQEPLQR